MSAKRGYQWDAMERRATRLPVAAASRVFSSNRVDRSRSDAASEAVRSGTRAGRDRRWPGAAGLGAAELVRAQFGLAGGAYLLLGSSTPTGGSIFSAVHYSGENGYDRAGFATSNAGDVDGGGLDEILVGAPGNGGSGVNAGAAYLVLGGSATSANLSTALKYSGEAEYDSAGRAVAGGGDVNADGYGDFLIGAPYNGDGANYAGATYLVLGSSAPTSSSLSIAIQYTGESASDFSGGSVEIAGDVDADGFDDLVAAPSVIASREPQQGPRTC